jgi:hypothetical protein
MQERKSLKMVKAACWVPMERCRKGPPKPGTWLNSEMKRVKIHKTKSGVSMFAKYDRLLFLQLCLRDSKIFSMTVRDSHTLIPAP